MPNPIPTVWALNELGAVSFFSKALTTLPPEDVALIAFHLKRYVANTSKERVRSLSHVSGSSL